MIAFYANRPEEAVVYIPHVYVSPLYRHQGLFTQMLKIAKEHVKQKGFITMRLEVNNNNMQAQNAYLRNGFHFLPEDAVMRGYFLVHGENYLIKHCYAA